VLVLLLKLLLMVLMLTVLVVFGQEATALESRQS
jgi:hypothetical protein